MDLHITLHLFVRIPAWSPLYPPHMRGDAYPVVFDEYGEQVKSDFDLIDMFFDSAMDVG